jgi:hypothetical protein
MSRDAVSKSVVRISKDLLVIRVVHDRQAHLQDRLHVPEHTLLCLILDRRVMPGKERIEDDRLVGGQVDGDRAVWPMHVVRVGVQIPEDTSQASVSVGK